MSGLDRDAASVVPASMPKSMSGLSECASKHAKDYGWNAASVPASMPKSIMSGLRNAEGFEFR